MCIVFSNSKTKTSYLVMFYLRHPGVIWSEAKTRCGSESDLRDSIARGDVVEITTAGNRKLYMFPTLQLNDKKSRSSLQSISRGLKITGEQYDEIGKVMDDLDFSSLGGSGPPALVHHLI